MTELHPDTIRLRWLAANPHTVRWYPDRRKWGALQHLSSTVSEANASLSFRVLDSLDEALAWAMGESTGQMAAPTAGTPHEPTILTVHSKDSGLAELTTEISAHPLLLGDPTIPRHPAFSTTPIFIDNRWWWRTPPVLVGSYITVGWLGAAKTAVAVSLEVAEDAADYRLCFEPPYASASLPLSHVADALLWRPMGD